MEVLIGFAAVLEFIGILWRFESFFQDLIGFWSIDWQEFDLGSSLKDDQNWNLDKFSIHIEINRQKRYEFDDID